MKTPRPTVRSSTTQTAALAISAVIMLVPAYSLPVMHLGFVGHVASETTILSGVVQLWQQGLGGLAAIVFTASFLVPLLKLAGLAGLLAAAWRKPGQHPRLLTWIYGAVDFIGRWSMLDVFLVAFLSGAVRFGKLATVQPRPGILAFGAVVMLTMLATRRFDPRMLWIDVPFAGSGPDHASTAQTAGTPSNDSLRASS
jgi:paraquat-inducible protein A